MSALVDQAADSKRPRRRPQGGRGGRRGPRAPKPEGAAAAAKEPKEAAAPREKRERPESIPVPAEWVGQSKVGVVSTVIRKGRVRFGFINICPGPEIDEKTPRIYFSLAKVPNDTHFRRGYVVSFKIVNDEQSRPSAEDVTLTEEGTKIAAVREAEIAEKRAERAAAAPAAKPAAVKKERAPRERKPVEEKPVTLTVSCEGKDGTQSLTFNANQSIGRLKRQAVDAFQCEISFNVYHGEEFLTKSILLALKDGDKLRLAAPKEPKA